MDKPTQSEANPICASSIRLHLHLAQVQVFVVFHSWTVFPTDTPAETQNPPQVVSGYLTDKRIRRLTVLHPLIRFPSVGHPFSPTDTPAEIQNPPQVTSGYLADKRIQRLTVIHPFIRFPSVGHPFSPTDTPTKTQNPPQVVSGYLADN